MHKDQGPGLLESIYERFLTMELGGTRQRGSARVCDEESGQCSRSFKRFRREYPLRCDLLVEGCLIVEVKASGLVHFNEQKLTEDVSRLILPDANLE